jgi:hypothetical protein
LMKDFEAGILTTQLLEVWKSNLEPLVEELNDKAALGRTLSCVLERETWAMRGELTNGHYIYMLDKTLNRLQQTLDKLSSDLNPRINLGSMTVMAYSHRPYTSGLLINVTVDRPAEMNQFKLRPYFVGKMDAVFETDEEKQFHVPTWKALEWLVEDFGMTRTLRIIEDKQYQMSSGAWQEGVPLGVSSDPRFCTLGPRRGKWSPEATIESTNYNWMMIEGSFSTWENCAATYQ